MTASAPIGVLAAGVSLVHDAAYHEAALGLIEGAVTSCLASVFIVDLNAHHDPDTKVLRLLRALRDATWRGVDVRLLIGGSRRNLAIAEACQIAWDQAGSLGVACRLLGEERGSHVKLIAADDRVLSGSHNWSLGAFGGQVQDSLLVRSRALAAYMRALFERQWARAGGEG